MLVKVSTPPDGVDGGVEGVDGADPAADTGYGMLPFEPALSYASALLPALRTHTPTRAAELAEPGVHVQRLLVVHCIPIQLVPS